jgi:hypothetical protein
LVFTVVAELPDWLPEGLVAKLEKHSAPHTLGTLKEGIHVKETIFPVSTDSKIPVKFFSRAGLPDFP